MDFKMKSIELATVLCASGKIKTPKDEDALLGKIFSLAKLIETRLEKELEGTAVFRKEDIDAMIDSGVKPLFPEGQPPE